MESKIWLKDKTKKQVDDRNEWLRWREKISLWIRFKEKKWGDCQKKKRCKMSGTNKNEKRCKLKGTEEYVLMEFIYLQEHGIIKSFSTMAKP